MKTHLLIPEKDHIFVMGLGQYFSWIIEIEYNQFVLSSQYGKGYNTFNTLRQALDAIGYEG